MVGAFLFVFYSLYALISFLLWYVLARLLNRLLVQSGSFWASRAGFQPGWIAWFLSAAVLFAFSSNPHADRWLQHWPYASIEGWVRRACWTLVALRIPPRAPAIRPFSTAFLAAAVVQFGSIGGHMLGYFLNVEWASKGAMVVMALSAALVMPVLLKRDEKEINK